MIRFYDKQLQKANDFIKKLKYYLNFTIKCVFKPLLTIAGFPTFIFQMAPLEKLKKLWLPFTRLTNINQTSFNKLIFETP